MKNRAGEGYFVRDPERDLVYCPGGGNPQEKKHQKKMGATRYANRQACKGCPYRDKCVNGKGNTNWKETDFGKDSLEKKAKWWKPEEAETQKKKQRNQEKRTRRRQSTI